LSLHDALPTYALRPDVPNTWLPYTYSDVSHSADSTEPITRRIRADLCEQADGAVIHVATGQPERVILDVAEREQCGLVIMGANGAGGADAAVGTTSVRMLRQSQRSILIVRSRPRADYQRLLVGTDFTAESRHGLETA